MDIRTLQTFLTLSETLHFGRTADASHMSPSTLTRSIKQLESTLGVSLFERDNRSVTLTAEGELFRRYARESLALWSSFQNNLMEATQQLSGTLTLYGSVTASYSFLFERLADLHERHPGIRITLQTGDPEQAIARVQAGDADVSIGARPAVVPPALAFKAIATTPLVLIAPRDDTALHNLSDPDAASALWARTPVILPERGVARDRITQWFRRRGVAPQISAQVSGNEAIVSMVSLGGGVGVVPRIVLDNSPLADRVFVVPVSTEPEPLEVGLFVMRRSLKNKLVEALWNVAPANDERNLPESS